MNSIHSASDASHQYVHRMSCSKQLGLVMVLAVTFLGTSHRSITLIQEELHTLTLPTSISSSQDVIVYHPMDEASYERRMNFYRERYGYQEPQSSRLSNSSRSSSNNNKTRIDGTLSFNMGLCGSAPDFEWFFSWNNTETWDPPKGKRKPQYTSHRSANNEDKIIYRTFFQDDGLNQTSLDDNDDKKQHPRRRRSSRIYIELGANDGISESNTRFFDECLGWDNGILIEGYPHHRDRLVKNRPHAHIFSFAPSCPDDTNALYGGAHSDINADNNSFRHVLNQSSNNFTVPFVNVPFLNSGLVGSANAYPPGYANIVDVPCGSITPILWDVLLGPTYTPLTIEEEGHSVVPHVDFFSLDVEGSEPLVLQQIQWDMVQIDIIMVEVINTHCPTTDACASREATRSILMEKGGYVQFSNWIHKSDVFVHPIHAPHHLQSAQRATNHDGIWPDK